MAHNEDSQPVTVLRQSAEDFKSIFEKDIGKCLATLNSKISSLLCDPDSVSDSQGKTNRLTAHMEFSKAKYDIFISMKALYDEIEAYWLEHLAEMKATFLERVEIFLAGTKLEVNLPTSEAAPQNRRLLAAAKRHTGKQESSSPAIPSIYPKLFDAAKHFPVLNSFLPNANDKGLSEEVPKVSPLKQSGRTPKRVTINTSPSYKMATPPVSIEEDEELSSEEEPEVAPVMPLKQSGRTPRKVNMNTSQTYKKSRVSNSVPPVEEDEEFSSEEEVEVAPIIPLKQSGRTPKKVNMNTSQTYKKSRVSNSVPPVEEDEEFSSEEEVEAAVQAPIRNNGRLRKSIANTPSSAKKKPAAVQARNNGRFSKSVANTPSSAKKEPANTPLRRGNASRIQKESSDSSDSEVQKTETQVSLNNTGIRGRRSIKSQSSTETVVTSTPSKKTRTPRKKTGGRALDQSEIIPEDDMETNEFEIESRNNALAPGVQKTPRQVHFSLGLDVNEDLDIYSPESIPSKPTPRRKTMVGQVMENFSDICLTPVVARSKSKRKTIAGNASDLSAPSPKRLKRGGSRTSLAPSALAMEPDEPMDSNLLGSEGTSESGHYSPWIPLSDVGGKIPTLPGIYELKVAQAKKPAYIGACESLRQMLTLHKLKHNSGHKHLDKFIERNIANVLVRYEELSSVAEAKSEEKSRVKSFVGRYKTTPAYN